MNTKHKGDIAEQAAALQALRRSWSVSRPVGDNQPYDLIFDISGALVKVQVKSVQVANVKGKEKRFGRFVGSRRNWKKAYVCLAPGQEINFAATE